jgi:hypothetical protein
LTLRMRSAVVAIAFLLLFGVPQARPCTWAVGYFYQVTALKGQVVGTNIALLQSARWLRQAFVRKHAKLTLYEYRWPRALNNMVPVKTVVTDTNGKLDFGTLRLGHYTLVADEENWGSSEWFDVELRDLPRVTEFVTIDVSPNFPDCTGGQEVVVKAK